jgi:hypothetical protein
MTDFGATGDGTTDDTAEINDAIATLSAGKTLYFPVGTYKVSETSLNRALMPLPIGANLMMEQGALLKASETSAVMSIVTVLGDNIIDGLNIDGQCLPDTSTVQSSDWQANLHIGVRAAFTLGSHGLGAKNVTILNSRFRNLDCGIQTHGAQGWTVRNCHFERLYNSGALMEYLDGYSCRYNRFENCTSDKTGDTCVAFHHMGGTDAECSYNTIFNCHAIDWGLKTLSFAFDVEARFGDEDASKQHHILFDRCTAEQTQTGMSHGIGVAIMNTVSESAILACGGSGSLNLTSDVGIAMGSGTRDSRIAYCNLRHFRGAGIDIDGTDRVTVEHNQIIDCGDDSSVHPGIRVSLSHETNSATVRANRYVINPTYPHETGASCGVAVRSVAESASNILIEGNHFASPKGNGVYVTGDVENKVDGVTLRGNTYQMTEETPANLGPALPVQVYRAKGVRIENETIIDCRYGYTVQSCDNVTVERCDARGTLTMYYLYDFANTSGAKVRGMRTFVAVTTVVNNAGSGTIFEDDDKIALINAPDDSAAATAGVQVGMTYRHGSIRMVRAA